MDKKIDIITEDELKKHNNIDDLWIAVDGYVYDVTNFAQEHPGTTKPLLFYAGHDATNGFNKQHPNVDISSIEKVILIGEYAQNVD